MKKSFSQGVMKAFMVLLAVCLCLTVAPVLTPDLLPVSNAETVTYTVPGTATVAAINQKLSEYAAGTTVKMQLSGNIDFTNTDNHGTVEKVGIVIPAGLDVRLYMNGKNIVFNSGEWEMYGICGIENNGALQIFSGSINTPTLSSGNSTILLANNRTDMTATSKNEEAYCVIVGIRNNGTLTVNSGIVIDCACELEYADNNSSCEASTTIGVTCIENAVDTNCTVNGATLNASSNGQSWTSVARRGHARSYTYGIYGGNVTVIGNTVINANARGYAANSATLDSDKTARINVVCFGIATEQNVTVTGGQINYFALSKDIDSGNSKKEACKEGYQRVFMGGILVGTKNNVTPKLYDGSVTYTSTDTPIVNSTGDRTFREGTVMKVDSMPMTGAVLRNTVAGNSRSDNDYPTGSFTQHKYVDEVGNEYVCGFSSSRDNRVTAITRGAPAGTVRVHVIYRYWTTKQKNALVTTIVGNTGLQGYSFSPSKDDTYVVKSEAEFNGFKSNALYKNPADGISYDKGGNSYNDYYWKQFNITSITTNEPFSTVMNNIAKSTYRGTPFKSFEENINNTAQAGATNPVYIFCDYYQQSATTLGATAGINGVAMVTYSGNPIKATDCGLKIYKNGATDTEYTSEYNVNLLDTSLMPVEYTWSGTNLAGINESYEDTHALPVNAGTYSVTISLPDTSVYDSQNCDISTHRNRKALSYTFTVIIEQAKPTRGTLPESISLQYGQKLGDVISITNYSALGVKQEAVAGTFSFTNLSDASTVKNAGAPVISITWTPTYSSVVSAKNYQPTGFNLTCNISKGTVLLSPTEAIVTYGESVFEKDFGVTISGLIDADSNETTVSQIKNAVIYKVFITSGAVDYTPGEIGAGEYLIQVRLDETDLPPVLNNYNITFADEVPGVEVKKLTVNKRGISVNATAVSRDYEPGNYKVNVTFAITAGKYMNDDVRVASCEGALSECEAGTREVNGITRTEVAKLITGGGAANYVLTSLTYSTGTSLLVNINQCTPNVNLPNIADMYYQRNRTLADVAIPATSSSVPGAWEWVDLTVNPTVKQTIYRAKFVPQDKLNYVTATFDITIHVLVTPVTITYKGTVEYGDAVPNITAYTYISDKDPGFTMTGVKTQGNLTPATTYHQGSPVTTEGYPVTITAQNFIDVDGNYSFTTLNGSITVKPRNIEFTVADRTIEYGENFVASESTVSVTFDESRLVGDDTVNSLTADGSTPTFSYQSDFRYADNYNAGTYNIKVLPRFEFSASYTVTVKQGTLTVTKAPLIIRADTIEVFYNDEVSNLQSAYTLIGAKRNDNSLSKIFTTGSMSLNTVYQKGSPVNATGYAVNVLLSTDASFANYEVRTEDGVIVVKKATPVINQLPTASIVYGQSLADAVFTGGEISGNVPGAYVYNASETVPSYRESAYDIYVAAFVPTDSENYNSVNNLTVLLTVNRKPIEGALAVSGIPMKGEILTVDLSGLNPDNAGDYVITWKMNGSTVSTGLELTLTDAHVNNAITVEAVAQKSYIGTATYVTTTISPELPSVKNVLNASQFNNYFTLTGLNFNSESNVAFNGTQHYVTLNQKSNAYVIVGDITVKYNGSTTAPVKAGTYRVTVDVATPDLSHVNDAAYTTYSPASNLMIGTLTVTKTAYHVTVTIADKEYDGTNVAKAKMISESGAVTLPGGAKDDVRFDSAKAIYTFENASAGVGREVNYGNIRLTGASADNYEVDFVLANNGKANINKRTLLVKIVPQEREYCEGDTSCVLDFETNPASLAVTDTESQVYVMEDNVYAELDGYNAGEHFVNVSGVILGGAKADNYQLSLTNLDGLTARVLKATPDYPVPDAGTVYYDAGRPLSMISLGDNRWEWDTSVASVIPTAGAHTYTAVFTPFDVTNYATVTYEVSMNVKKAPVTVRADSFEIIYGDAVPTYSYLLLGLTGADTKDVLGGYVSLDCAYQPGSAIGTYAVVFSGKYESSNYSFNYYPGSVTVKAKDIYVTAYAENRMYQQGNVFVDVTFSDLTGLYPDDVNSVYMAGSFPIQGTVDSDTAGTKTVNYLTPVLAGNKADNYNLKIANPNLKVEIQKAELVGVVFPTSGTVTYGQRLGSTVFSSDYQDKGLGTFAMLNPMTTPNKVGTFDNTYQVVFTPNNSLNYATVTKYIRLTVVNAELNIDMVLEGSNQVGSTLLARLYNVPDAARQYVVLNWYRLDAPNADIRTGKHLQNGTLDNGGDTYTLTEADEGYYIVCVATNSDNSPYTIYKQVVTAAKTTEEALSFWQKLMKVFYKLLSALSGLFG